MNHREYIPRSDSELLNYTYNIIAYSSKASAASTLAAEKWKVPAANVFLTQPLTDFEAKYVKTLDPHRSLIEIQLKNDAKAVLTKALRGYIQGFLVRNSLVDLEDRLTMKIPVYDMIPTNVPAPDIAVKGSFRFPAKGLVEIVDIAPDGDTADKRSRHGVRIYYGIMGAPVEKDPFRLSVRPKTGDDLPHSVFTRNRRYRFIFSGDNGKEVFFCMRFENSKGDAGPWGEMMSTFIP